MSIFKIQLKKLLNKLLNIFLTIQRPQKLYFETLRTKHVN